MESQIVDRILNIYYQRTNIRLDKKEYLLYSTQYCGGRPRLDIDGFMLIMQINEENTIRIEVIYSKRYNLELSNLIYEDSYQEKYRLNDFVYHCLSNDSNWINFEKDYSHTDGMWGMNDHWHYWKYEDSFI